MRRSGDPTRARRDQQGVPKVNPGGGLVTMVNARLSDPAFRQQIRDMHAQGASLLDMVEQLGLAGEMSPAVRSVVAGLDPQTVAEIRTATLDMLDRAENQMPLDCNVSQPDIDRGTPVSVSVTTDATPTIVVRASSSGN